MADLALFKSLIKARCGLQFFGADELKLQNALRTRCASLQIDQARYFPHLLADAEEFGQLVNLLTINETYFFREQEYIALFTDFLVGRLRELAPGRALRVLSAGCSSGEEPYSLAIALHERFGSAQGFEIFGADIDTSALSKAKEALYGDFSFRGVADNIRAKYFTRSASGYRLQAQLREQLQFHQLNLLAVQPPAALAGGFDVIFFRNVSIYFDLSTREQVLRLLAGMLRPDGALIVGAAETLANNLGVLPLVEHEGLFYFAQGALAQTSAGFARASAPLWSAARAAIGAADLSLPSFTPPEKPQAAPQAPSKPASQTSIKAPNLAPRAAAQQGDLSALRQLVVEQNFFAASAALDQFLGEQPRNLEALLLQAYVQLERRQFERASALAQRALEIDAWSVAAFVLLGLVARWSNEPQAAIVWFKKALYSHQTCWPAHYYLAELLRAQGQAEPAQRAYRAVLQQLDAKSDSGIAFLPLDLPIGDVRFLCERQLSALAQPKN